jgi:hypothetical protein
MSFLCKGKNIQDFMLLIEILEQDVIQLLLNSIFCQSKVILSKELDYVRYFKFVIGKLFQ